MGLKAWCLFVAIVELALASSALFLTLCLPCTPYIGINFKCGIGSIVTVIWLIVSSLLLYGVTKLENVYMLPWLVFTALAILLNLIILIYTLVKLCTCDLVSHRLYHTLIYLLAITLQVLCAVLVCALYQCNIWRINKQAQFEKCQSYW